MFRRHSGPAAQCSGGIVVWGHSVPGHYGAGVQLCVALNVPVCTPVRLPVALSVVRGSAGLSCPKKKEGHTPWGQPQTRSVGTRSGSGKPGGGDLADPPPTHPPTQNQKSCLPGKVKFSTGAKNVRPTLRTPHTRHATSVCQGNWFSVGIGPVPKATQ